MSINYFNILIFFLINCFYLGAGETIDIATEMAARESLKRLFHTTESDSPIRYDVTDVGTQVTNITLDEWSSEKVQNNLLPVGPK